MANAPEAQVRDRTSATDISRVLVTGGAGYLGRHIVERLKARFELTLFDCVPPEGDCRYVQGDIADPQAVADACRGKDAVVHTVALVRGREHEPAWRFADVVVKGTWNILEACVSEGVRRMVNISSVIADGYRPFRETPYRVDEPSSYAANDLHYCVSKKLAEVLCDAYAEAHGLSVISLRPGVIDGDGANPPITGRPEGVTVPWFMYVDPRDVAQAVECALRTERPRGTYSIVAGRRDSLFEWRPAAEDIGYAPEHNWPSVPEDP